MKALNTMKQFTTDELRTIYSAFGNKAAELWLPSKRSSPEAQLRYERYREIERKAYSEVIRRTMK